MNQQSGSNQNQKRFGELTRAVWDSLHRLHWEKGPNLLDWSEWSDQLDWKNPSEKLIDSC